MKNTLTLHAILLASLLVAGCGMNKNWVKIVHPGNYEIIEMGYTDVDGDRYKITRAHNKIFLSYLNTLGPTYFSVFLLEHTEIKEGDTVLDMGTGSGIQAIYAAEKAKHVLATDISERVLRNAMLNAKILGAEDKITVRISDIFNDIKPDEKFDVIIASIPYAWNEKTQDNWRLHERFFRDAGKHLKPDGRIYFLTGFLHNLPYTRELVENNRLKIMKINMVYSKIDNLEPIVYMIKHAPVKKEK